MPHVNSAWHVVIFLFCGRVDVLV